MTFQRFSAVFTVINLGLLIIFISQVRVSTAQTAPSVLRGQALEIVDSRGQTRARINVEPATTASDGKTYPESVVFRLVDPEGRIRVKLGADRDGSGLMLADDSQQPGLHMLAKGSGSFLKLVGKDGKEQLLKP